MQIRGRLAVFPAYRDNPYLNLMLLAPRAAGWSVLESTRLERLEADLGGLGAGDVFHMHWTAPIVQRADDATEARSRLDRFRSAVDAARARGSRLVWTVHNVLPHDARHVELELELDRFLASTADAVHVMNRATAGAVAPYYELDPATVVHIPHPSYQGVHVPTVDRAAARAAIGLTSDRPAVLLFGQLRPYKGVDLLLDAVSAVPSAERPAVLLAGRTSDADRAAIDAMMPPGVEVVRHHEHVPDEDVDRWFRAADVAVFPYTRMLNSGALHLAATLGTPSILPDEPHLRAEFGEEAWVSWYDPADAVASLSQALTVPPPDGGTAAFATVRAPYALSRRYAGLLAGLEARHPSPERVASV